MYYVLVEQTAAQYELRPEIPFLHELSTEDI